MSAPHEQDDRPPHEEFAFRIVRRGYDRDQVHSHMELLLSDTPPAAAPAFELVRRGYDQGQVDEVIARLHREAGQGR